MKLHEPIPNFKPALYPIGDVMQFFGGNAALYGPFGLKGHNGWDIVRTYGTPIFAVEAGKVVESQEDSKGNGKFVRILSDESEWVYGHLSRIDVKLKQPIEAGQQIGLMGNTGFVVSGPTPYWGVNPYAGTHLHLTRYPLKHWVSGSWNKSYPSGDKVNILYPDNGYGGAVDLSPEDFVERVDASTLSPADIISTLAAKDMSEGKTRSANILYAVAQFLRAFANYL